jgi:ABC-type sugar transport system substrate-binding protein
VILADTAVTTGSEGFIGTDNVKAGEQAGQRLCELVKKQGKTSGEVMIESSVAGIQTLKDRDAGFRRGFAAGCPQIRVGSPRFNNNDINTAASQVNDVITANRNLVGIFADNNTSGTGAAQRSRTTTPPGASRSSRSTPTRRRTRRSTTARSTRSSSRTRTSSATRAWSRPAWRRWTRSRR